MFTQIMPFLIAYFIYTFTKDLIQFEGPFGWAQWVMLALDIAFVLLLYPTGKRAIAAHKQSKEDKAAQMAEQQEKLDKQRLAKYYEDFSDGPGYDAVKAELSPGEDEPDLQEDDAESDDPEGAAAEADGPEIDDASAGSGDAAHKSGESHSGEPLETVEAEAVAVDDIPKSPDGDAKN